MCVQERALEEEEEEVRNKEGFTFRDGDSDDRTFLGDICEESKRINGLAFPSSEISPTAPGGNRLQARSGSHLALIRHGDARSAPDEARIHAGVGCNRGHTGKSSRGSGPNTNSHKFMTSPWSTFPPLFSPLLMSTPLLSSPLYSHPCPSCVFASSFLLPLFSPLL